MPISRSLPIAALVAATLSAGHSHGIVIRDGVPDSAYINFGNARAFNSVGQIQGGSASGGFAASGVLIAPDWVLTAAHVTAPATSLKFFMDSGGDAGSFGSRTGIMADRWVTHPGWNGLPIAGYDIGLMHLSTSVACGAALTIDNGCAAERYRGSGDVGQAGLLVGFGSTGLGSTGETTFDGLKRGAINAVDAASNSGRVLFADFDSGLASDNRIGSQTPGGLEGMIAPGDSGGALYELLNGRLLLVGVTSFGFGWPDLNPDSDYGDLGGWTRVSAFNSWIDATIAGGAVSSPLGTGALAGAGMSPMLAAAVPEPAVYAQLAAGLTLLAALGLRRRKQREV